MQKSKLNILISFGILRESDYAYHTTLPKKHLRFMLDSGAFQAFTSGKKINIDDYCRFIKSLSKTIDIIPVQLDVIGKPQITYKNYLYMLEKHKLTKVLPVYQRGGDIKILKDLRKLTDYILIGGLATLGDMKNSRKFVNYIYKNVPKTKFHWLGFVDPRFIAKYKPFSVDSSNTSMFVRFGRLLLFKDGYVHTFNPMHQIRKFGKFTKKDLHFLKICNVDLDKINALFKDTNANARGWHCYWNYLHILNVLKLSEYNERKYKTLYYHASVGKEYTELIYKVYKKCYLEEKTIDQALAEQ